ncbi:MAG TPA: hypothetical protein VFZ65_17150 [Planctomycetota bacterium]|nr:hypothetical protein [Planctomycetota bacterium]
MIVVTGMHRSGTSLACQLLHALGLPFEQSRDLYATDRWNEAGYYELKSVMDANSRIITGLPRNRSRWLAVLSKVVYVTMPGNARIEARARKVRPAIAALAGQYHDRALKDPRFCLTLRFWDQCAPIERVVVCLREPTAVVASLSRRNRLPAHLGFRFWQYHMQALLQQLPLDRAVFVDMDRLAIERDAHELEPVRRFLRLDAGPAGAVVLQDVLRADSYARSTAAGRCPASVQVLWERLRALADQRRSFIMDPVQRVR